jgi:hypothetical protein
MAGAWMRMVAGAMVHTAVAAGALACLAFPARAGERSLIAGFHAGDEVRYTFTVRGDETTSITGKTGMGAQANSTETVGVLFRCKADTIPLCILDVVYESFHISMDTPQGKVDLDVGGPAPDASASELARDVYRNLHGIVGTTVTLNTAPGSGEITAFRGGEQLLKTPGASVLRRYLDKDLFTATFGPILQLKSNSSSPPPGEKWYVKRNIFAYAHPGKTPIWETRMVDNVLADIATIKGAMLANATGEVSDKTPAFFRNVSGNVVYTWDLSRGKLLSANRTEVINSRFLSDKVLKESDLITKSSLELVKPKEDAAAEKPTDKPAVKSPEGAAPTNDGKGKP